jgi:hypothetical protein
MSKKDLEKEINILEHEIFIERVLTRAMGKNTISLRDHFAGLAMQSLLTKASITVGSDSVAMAAYHVAHQMLKERSRGEKRDDT